MFLHDTEIVVPEYKKIESELKFQGRSINWLANNLNLCYHYTRRLIKGERPLTEKNIQKINQLLKITN